MVHPPHVFDGHENFPKGSPLQGHIPKGGREFGVVVIATPVSVEHQPFPSEKSEIFKVASALFRQHQRLVSLGTMEGNREAGNLLREVAEEIASFDDEP